MRIALVDDEIAQKHHNRYTHSVMQKLVQAFKELGYKDPEMESEVLMLLVEGLWQLFVTNGDKQHCLKMVALIKSKYAKQ